MTFFFTCYILDFSRKQQSSLLWHYSAPLWHLHEIIFTHRSSLQMCVDVFGVKNKQIKTLFHSRDFVTQKCFFLSFQKITGEFGESGLYKTAYNTRMQCTNNKRFFSSSRGESLLSFKPFSVDFHTVEHSLWILKDRPKWVKTLALGCTILSDCWH